MSSAHETAKALIATSPCPLTAFELADMNRKAWDVVERLDQENKRLRDENERLKLSLLHFTDNRFEN